MITTFIRTFYKLLAVEHRVPLGSLSLYQFISNLIWLCEVQAYYMYVAAVKASSDGLILKFPPECFVWQWEENILWVWGDICELLGDLIHPQWVIWSCGWWGHLGVWPINVGWVGIFSMVFTQYYVLCTTHIVLSKDCSLIKVSFNVCSFILAFSF